MMLLAVLLLVPGALIGFLVVLGLYLLYAATQARKRRKLQHQLLAHAGSAAGTSAFAVKYTSGANFKSLWKVFPWEASGVLRLTDGGVQFDGATTAGKPLRLDLPAATTTAVWVGRKAVNGATAWLELRHGGDRHYLTAETGATVRNSEADTRRLLQAIEAHLLARTLGDGPTA